MVHVEEVMPHVGMLLERVTCEKKCVSMVAEAIAPYIAGLVTKTRRIDCLAYTIVALAARACLVRVERSGCSDYATRLLHKFFNRYQLIVYA